MKSERRILIIAGIVIGLPFALYYGARLKSAFLDRGYTLADMDWNSDGHTTFAEVIEGSDVGARPWPNDTRCREFFRYKETHVIKVVCPSGIGKTSMFSK